MSLFPVVCLLNRWQKASSARYLQKKVRDLTTSWSSKFPSPDSADVICTENEVIQYCALTQYSCKPLCPLWSDLIVTEIEVSQCCALPQYSCKIWSDYLRDREESVLVTEPTLLQNALPLLLTRFKLRSRWSSSGHCPNTRASLSDQTVLKFELPLRSRYTSDGQCANTPGSLSASCPFISHFGSSSAVMRFPRTVMSRVAWKRTLALPLPYHYGCRPRRSSSIGQWLTDASCPLSLWHSSRSFSVWSSCQVVGTSPRVVTKASVTISNGCVYVAYLVTCVVFFCTVDWLTSSVSPFPPDYFAGDISLSHIDFLCVCPDECSSFSGDVVSRRVTSLRTLNRLLVVILVTRHSEVCLSSLH